MFARSDMLASAPRGRCAAHAALPPRTSAGLALAVLLLAGCAGVPSAPIAGAHPADPQAPARPAAYRSMTAGGSAARPAEPSKWQDSNERVAPGEKP